MDRADARLRFSRAGRRSGGLGPPRLFEPGVPARTDGSRALLRARKSQWEEADAGRGNRSPALKTGDVKCART